MKRPYLPSLILLLFVFILSFSVRLYHLNYNSPFNDEASDIVVGRLGVFQGDWWTYNTSAWLAGFPYIYPPMTAIASMTGGVVGSRFLNVLFGVLTVEFIFILTALISRYKHPYDCLAGIVAACIAGGSAVAIYISRLATYDAPSFCLFFLSLIPLVQAEQKNRNTGRLYFYAAIVLLLACLTKIIIFAYLPIVLLYSFYRAWRNGKEALHFWKIYFLSPILLIVAFYGIGNFSMLKTYAHVNAQRDLVPIKDFFMTMWRDSMVAWVFWVVASIGLLLTRRWKLWMLLTFCALWIAVPHVLTRRALWTFEKQVAVTIYFLSCMIGIGYAGLVKKARGKAAQALLITLFTLSLVFYWARSSADAQRFNHLWANSSAALQYLGKTARSGDRILAESGGTAVLATYDRNFPTNTATFDWFVYHKQTGEKAYLSAVKDGYFDIIELEGEGQQGDAIFSQLHNKVYAALAGNYQKAYSRNGFVIYHRVF